MVDIDLQPTAAGAPVRLFELLEEADRMCEASELLTMAAPPEVVELRRWMCSQIAAHTDREEQPEPFRR